MPAINVPYLLNSEGMPLGLQLLAPRGGDARLLRATQVFSQLLEH
jgi:Asp-tRNA(Asn)/Glu-tRNA(Gln) amidotransferase A subunit family amidase